jgi:DNA modification methylase
MGLITESVITDRYAMYNGDSMEVMADLPDVSVHAVVYSPPFAYGDEGIGGAGLYKYSSSPRDLSNAGGLGGFLETYRFFVAELHRVTMPGRLNAVHCMDTPMGNSGGDSLHDFPGDLIRLHQDIGYEYVTRHTIWKEPLAVRNRTMVKDLTHKTVIDDASRAGVAGADYLLVFRKRGDNPVPVTHPRGLTAYHGAASPPADVLKYRGWTGNQIENRYSQWVWRQYASSVWDDIRGNLGQWDKRGVTGVLPYREARDEEDEKHVHPLQLDVIRRFVDMRTNPGEIVLSPFAGVGSELYAAVELGRRGIGAELKPSYYRQALKNLAAVDADTAEDPTLFGAEVS